MGSVPITAGSGTPIRTISNSGIDGGANQQVVSLADDTGAFLSTSAIPSGNEEALLVRAMPTQVIRTGFSDAYSSGVDPSFGSVVKTGSGQTVSQSGGNLIVTAGTTANAETIIRSLGAFGGATRFRIRSTLSQRIANQQFFVEMVDIIQDAASVTINSATTVTVTFTANPFNSTNVGQYMYLGGYTGSGTFISGRYAIASVSGQTVTYTVSGFATGSGTVSVFGWNHHHLIYSGTSTTAALWDVQRKGWNSGDTTISINNSSSPGHVALMQHNDMHASVMDGLVASNTTPQFTPRGSRIENVPDTATMQLQLRIVNGSTAPASSTTWTVGQLGVANWSPMDVAIQDTRPQANMTAQPVQVANTVNVSGLVGLNAGTNNVGAVRIGAYGSTSTPVVTAASTNATLIRNGLAWLQELTVSNPTATACYLKVYNMTTAPTVGTSVPVFTIRIPATGTDKDFQSMAFGAMGKLMGSGISIAVTGAAAATDTSAGPAGVQIHMTYAS